MKLFGIDFIPLNVPLRRRAQTASVILFQFLFLFSPIVSSILFVTLLFTPLFWISCLYFAWIWYDHTTSSRGGRRQDWFRRARVWTYFRDFFPISLIKTAELSPEHNYILGYHPHGILGCGAFSNFATEATGFSDAFPGITPFTLTLKANFWFPILRGLLLFCGACDVSRESLMHILTERGAGGNAAIIVIGGAEESLEARRDADSYRLKLADRKGFVKMALRTGAHLVPVFSFGENDLFSQAANPRGSVLRRFQECFKKTFGFAPPLFFGRGAFNYTFGFVPYRHPVNTVVGAPIAVARTPEPSQAEIDALHGLYMDALVELFERFKQRYNVPEGKRIEFV